MRYTIIKKGGILLLFVFYCSLFVSGKTVIVSQLDMMIHVDSVPLSSEITPPKWARIHCLGFRPDIFVLHLREHGSYVESFSCHQEEIPDSISLYLRNSIYDFYVSEKIPVIESVKPKTIDKITDYPSIAVEFPYKGDILTKFTNINETIDSRIIHTPEFMEFYRVIHGQCYKIVRKENINHVVSETDYSKLSQRIDESLE